MPSWTSPPPRPERDASDEGDDRRSGRVDCFRCRHLRITHQIDHPYACDLFGMRTRQLPSLVVFQSSGAPCRGFEAQTAR